MYGGVLMACVVACKCVSIDVCAGVHVYMVAHTHICKNRGKESGLVKKMPTSTKRKPKLPPYLTLITEPLWR